MYESYEIFKNVLTTAFNEDNGPREEDYTYEVVTVNKMNQSRDGITRRYDEPKATAVLYLDELYITAKHDCLSPKDLMIYIDEWFDDAELNTPASIKAVDLNNIDPSRIYPVVINTERNAELLTEVPHREIADLSVVYYYNITDEASFLIKNDALNSVFHDYDEESLHICAIQNAASDAVLAPLFLMMMGKRHNLLEDEHVSEFNPNEQFVLTYENGYRGAGIVACGTILKEVYDLMKGGYYILPASVHEVIVLKTDAMAETLREMVRNVNETEVSEQDFLSNNVYYYNGYELVLVA